jgi:hypothetical protein
MRRGTGKSDRFAVDGITERVGSYAYEDASADVTAHADAVEDDLVEKAATLLRVMPPNQPRKTIEGLVAPHDPDRAERAVAVLIETSFAVEDADGRLRRLA